MVTPREAIIIKHNLGVCVVLLYHFLDTLKKEEKPDTKYVGMVIEEISFLKDFLASDDI